MNHRKLQCPEEIKRALDRYVVSGVPTGDFLRAVLANDLMLAVQRADPVNYQHLFAICAYVWERLPEECHGNDLIVAKHLHEFQTR